MSVISQMFFCCTKGQLWRLLVASAIRPAFWAEERTDEGKLVKYESRQLGGFDNKGRRGDVKVYVWSGDER
jgi:hypothetical protein